MWKQWVRRLRGLKCSGVWGFPLANEGSSPSPHLSMPSRAGPCERLPVSLKGLSSNEIRGHFSFLWPVLEGVFQLALLGPSNYRAATSGNDRPAGSRQRAAAARGPRPRPGQSGVSAGIGVCRARVGPRTRELGRQRPPERTRFGPETLPSPAFPRSPPAPPPQEQSSPPPCPGASPVVRCQEAWASRYLRPQSCVPAPRGHLCPLHPHSRPRL